MAKSVKSSMKCGEIRKSTRPGKKVMQKVCKNGSEKLIHAGAKGYGNNYSDAARKSFKERHKCSTAEHGTPRHLACNALWKKGGSKTSNPSNRKGKY